jgi:hypothetical protein
VSQSTAQVESHWELATWLTWSEKFSLQRVSLSTVNVESHLEYGLHGLPGVKKFHSRAWAYPRCMWNKDSEKINFLHPIYTEVTFFTPPKNEKNFQKSLSREKQRECRLHGLPRVKNFHSSAWANPRCKWNLIESWLHGLPGVKIFHSSAWAFPRCMWISPLECG